MPLSPVRRLFRQRVVHSNRRHELCAYGGLSLGESTGSSGSYSLSGSGYLVAPDFEIIGESGSGAFIQSGGTNSAGELSVDSTGASGTYKLSGGYLTAAYEYVGNSGSGAFTQTGGTNSANYGLLLGNNDRQHRLYNLSDGSLFAGYITDGNYASGTFTQTGGTTTVGGSIYVGANAPATGSYTLSGSGYLFSAGTEYVGFGSSGTFTQTGGTNSTAIRHVLGNNAGSSGSYSISGGSPYRRYRVRSAIRAAGVHAIRRHDLVANNLYMGYNSGSSGSFNLSGGSLMVSTRRNSSAIQGAGRLPRRATRIPLPPALRWVKTPAAAARTAWQRAASLADVLPERRQFRQRDVRSVGRHGPRRNHRVLGLQRRHQRLV